MEGVSRVAKIRDTPTGGENPNTHPKRKRPLHNTKTHLLTEKMASTPSENTLKKTANKTPRTHKTPLRDRTPDPHP